LFSWTERLSAGTALPRDRCGYGGYASNLNIYNSAPVFCLAGKRDCVLELLSQGANVECGYGRYASVLNISNSAPSLFCSAGKRDCLFELISQGADVDVEDVKGGTDKTH
jgi:hypothetical protein